MSTKFTVGNYYKNETRNRELVVLVTSRTKCFISYKKYWISDLDECCTEGKIKIKVDEDGSEYVLIDGYDKYKSSNEYAVKEEEESNEIITFDEVMFNEVKTFALSCGYNLITEEEYALNSGYNLITERKNENNFRLSTISGKGQFVQLTDVIKTIKEGTLLNKEYCPLPFSMTEDEVREFALSCGYANFYGWHGGYILNDKYCYTLADIVDAVKKGELLTGESCAIARSEEESFIEAREYALNCGYILTKLSNQYCNFSVCSTSNRIGQFRGLTSVSELIREGWLLIGESCAWPINSNSHTHNSLNNSPAIANLNLKNKEEEIKEVRIRKVNLRIGGKAVAIDPDIHRNLKLTHDPIFGWQLVGTDSQKLREPLNPQTKEQPTIRFKTRESASRFAEKLMAKIKNMS